MESVILNIIIHLDLKPKIDDFFFFLILYFSDHGLWTPNEGINQRYLKNWADVADKTCFGCT